MSELDFWLAVVRGFFAEVEGHEVIYITTGLGLLLWKWMDGRRSPRICRADLLELAAQFQASLTAAVKEFRTDMDKHSKENNDDFKAVREWLCKMASDIAHLRGQKEGADKAEGKDEKK